MRSRGPISLLLAIAVALSSITACRDTNRAEPPAPVDDTTAGGGVQPREADTPHRMSTRTKVVILAGAAALYYLYKKHKNAAKAEGVEGQYYLSKNGRVYYRDADHRAHWVTPPPGGIAVPASEAAEYRDFQGYDNRTTGRDLTSVTADPAY
jgi:hypothetical protein